jgi:hypothetical protein
MEKETLILDSDNGIIATALMLYATFLTDAVEECEIIGIEVKAQQRLIDRVNELEHEFRNKSDE